MFLIRFFSFFLLCFTFLHAANTNGDIIDKLLLAGDDKTFKGFREYNLDKEQFQNFYLKVYLNPQARAKNRYYLRITCDVNNFKGVNAPFKIAHGSIIVKIAPETAPVLTFNYQYPKKQLADTRIFIINEFELEYILDIYEKLYGLAYGIMFCAFLYNFVLYFYNKERSFLYYSLFQLAVLTYLVNVVRYDNQVNFSTLETMIVEAQAILAMFFMVLFSQEILNTKKHLPKINTLMCIVRYLIVIDLIFIISLEFSFFAKFRLISTTAVFPIIAGFLLYKKLSHAKYYLFGWSVLFISAFSSELRYFELDLLYTLHFGLPLESLILTFALGYKMREIKGQKEEKERMLIHQSRLAFMGEMINNIAHQWRQPLTHLSYAFMNLHSRFKQEVLTEAYFLEKKEEINQQLNFMSQTIDDFRNFYKPNKQKERFLISQPVQKALDIIKPSLDNNFITLEVDIKSEEVITAYENEYAQVVLNLLSNAKEALLSRKIDEPHIKIIIKNKTLEVIDNAKGVEEKILEKIFEPYFSTKHKGSGIGLYMCKTIIEQHFQGSLHVKNTENGACFSLVL